MEKQLRRNNSGALNPKYNICTRKDRALLSLRIGVLNASFRSVKAERGFYLYTTFPLFFAFLRVGGGELDMKHSSDHKGSTLLLLRILVLHLRGIE